MSDYPPEWSDRHIIAGKRIRSILRRQVVAGMRTIEQKISDSGPNPQRVQPHILTEVRKFLSTKNLIHEINEPNARWYYLHGTDPKLLQSKVALLSHLQLQIQELRQHLGQTLEVAISRALMTQSALVHWGYFADLDQHDDSTLYSKVEPPAYMSGKLIPEDKQLDFLVMEKASGFAGIEAKNIREWIYPNRIEVRELLKKCCALDVVPVLIARRINFSTFSILNRCGVLFHETYNQLYPASAKGLASQVSDKDLLGYHDIRVGNVPDDRLTKFIGINLPILLPEARRRFDEYKELLCQYGNEEITYDEFAAEVKARTE